MNSYNYIYEDYSITHGQIMLMFCTSWYLLYSLYQNSQKKNLYINCTTTTEMPLLFQTYIDDKCDIAHSNSDTFPVKDNYLIVINSQVDEYPYNIIDKIPKLNKKIVILDLADNPSEGTYENFWTAIDAIESPHSDINDLD